MRSVCSAPCRQRARCAAVLNVLHLRSSPFVGSPEKLLLGRIAYLLENDCRYVVGIFGEQPGQVNDFARAVVGAGCSAIVLACSISHFARNLVRLKRAVLEHDIDVVCSHDYKSNTYAAVLKCVTGVKAVAVYHGRTKASRRVAWYYRLDDLLLRTFELVVCVSSASAAKMTDLKVQPEKIVVIPNAVDCEAVERLSGERDALQEEIRSIPGKKIVFAGRLSAEKGVVHLLKAARIILRQYPECCFVVLGDGPERASLEAKIAVEQLRDRVVLAGYKNNIMNILKDAEYLVLPSLDEGMPVVVLEAYALGKPVICTRVGGVPEIVSDRTTGLLVESGNIEQLVEANLTLLKDRSLTETLGANAGIYVRKHHTFAAMSERYAVAYRRALFG